MRIPARARFTFLSKIIAAASLVAFADVLFFDQEFGWTLGGFALAWTIGLLLTRRDVRRDRWARITAAVAIGYGLLLIDDPGPLKWSLFGVAIGSATLLPLRRFDDALSWAGDLIVYGIFGAVAPLRDASRLTRIGRSKEGLGIERVVKTLLLPIGGGTIFLALFASANPIIADALAAIRLPDFSELLLHLIFWTILLAVLWATFRPRTPLLRSRTSATEPTASGQAHVPVATLTLSLIVFNAIFAVQNALDIAFLWSGAPLPKGVTLADYAHRGAYPLILTALLAGGFVLLAARPGSVGEADGKVRRLITLWVAQNVLLVASSVLRTVDYIAAYSLTGLRIAALAWMGLVALGLILILWRMLGGRSTRWLINANALAAGIVLTAGCVVDIGAMAASWNVRHARKASDLDMCYFQQLGPSALLPLMDLRARVAGPALRDQTDYLVGEALAVTRTGQADWHSWTWRNARRLATAERRLAEHPLSHRPKVDRLCGGKPVPASTPTPPPTPTPTPVATPTTVVTPTPTPLTKAPRS